jgi:hypothetical protein
MADLSLLSEIDAARLASVLSAYEGGSLGVQQPGTSPKRVPIETYYGRVVGTIPGGGTGRAEVFDALENDQNFHVKAFNGGQATFANNTPLILVRDAFTGIYSAIPLTTEYVSCVSVSGGTYKVETTHIDGTKTCTSNPNGCCRSGPGSGFADCCPGITMPGTLYATFGGGLSCCDTSALYFGGGGSWGSDLVPLLCPLCQADPATGGNSLTALFCLNRQPDVWDIVVTISRGGAGTGSALYQVLVDLSSVQCSPFYLTATLTLLNNAGQCGLTTTGTIVISE